MAFESRRLRVQLWCGDVTEVCDERVSLAEERGPTAPIFCFGSRCGFSCDRFQSYPETGTVVLAVCDAWATKAHPVPIHCGGTPMPVEQVDYAGPGLVDAAQLPMLRAQLEAQLKEVEAAERAVKEFRERETKD